MMVDGRRPRTYLKGQNKYLFWYLTSFSSWQYFNIFCPNFLSAVYATRVLKPTILAKIWNCTRPNCCAGLQIFGGSFSRTERKLTFLDGIHGLEVVGPQEGGGLTIRPDYMIRANSVVYHHRPKAAQVVYSVCKYTAIWAKSVWKYTHLANDHHKPYTARISFSSKLASIVFFRPQKLFAFSKDIFFGTILWDSSERHKISNRTDSFILLKVFAAVWRLQKDYKVWNNNWGSQTRWYCLTFKII